MTDFASFDGTRLHYEIEGEAADGSPPVVLLHGYTSSVQGNWREPGILAALVTSGRQVIGLDARGHGKSDKPHDPSAYADGAMVKDVVALFDHLGLVEADVVGYSMGAGTAVRFAAADHRVRRLVLGGIGGDPNRTLTDDDRAKAAERTRPILEALEAPSLDAIESKAGRRTRRLMESRDNDLTAMAAIMRSGLFTTSYAPTDVIAPTLVVCGDQDASPVELAAAVKDGRSLVLTGDHEGVVVNPELATAIVDFVNA